MHVTCITRLFVAGWGHGMEKDLTGKSTGFLRIMRAQCILAEPFHQPVCLAMFWIN
jgi:hypothetical protein